MACGAPKNPCLEVRGTRHVGICMYGGFPKLGGIIGVPYSRDYRFLGSILGSPYFGNLPYIDM